MRMALAVLCCTLAAAPALGQTTASGSTALDIQLFHPAPGGNDFVTVQSADPNSHLGLSAGLSLNYSKDPLSLQLLRSDGTKDSIGGVVKTRIDANLLLALGLYNIGEIGLAMPLVSQGGYEGDKINTGAGITLGAAPKSFTQGDLRLVPKVRFVRLAGGVFSGAVVANVVLPTSSKAAYAGESGVVVAPGLAFSSRLGPARLALDLGYVIRKETQLESLVVGNQITAGLGLALALGSNPERPFELVGEVYGRTPAKHAFGLGLSGDAAKLAKSDTAFEGTLGLRWGFMPNLAFTLGGGGGLLPGYGASAPRVYLAVGFYTGEPAVSDRDHDGIPDELDKCPDQPEDFDGFQDDDGCPDPDNDNDGVLDEDDECPNEAGPASNNGCPLKDRDGDGLLNEVDKCPDVPGPIENQGCPDVDTDGDGIVDRLDQCPNEPEDKDGFQDEDGCPDPDNDGDGLPDLNDLCPNQAEDFEGIDDEDGCPEDSDGDGIPNALDKCPFQAEDYEGIEDDDGCPEGKTFKPLVEVTKEKIEIKDKIFFKAGNAEILAKSYPLLDQVGAVLKGYKHILKIRIEGHTDAAGPRAANMRLSRERAEAVLKYLVGKGVEATRLESEGFGPDKPIASNKTAKGKEMNRRVEFTILEQKPVGVDVTDGQKPPEPVIEMPGMESPTTTAPGPAKAPPPPSSDTPLFEIGNEPPAATPAPAAEEPKAKKAKGKKGKAPKKEKKDQPSVDFNF